MGPGDFLAAENHETQSEFEKSWTLKIFLFEFVNNYSSIFYVAFFQGRFAGYPGNYPTFLGFRQDECPEYGCLIELTIQLAIVMIGRQFVDSGFEIAVGWFRWLFASWRYKRANASRSSMRASEIALSLNTPWVQDFSLPQYSTGGLLLDFLECVMQFGFITLFVGVFPLGPFFALWNNIFEIRVDAIKLVYHSRRPWAMRADGIGIWMPILNGLAFVSVITNGLSIAITSTFLPKIVFKYLNAGSLAGYLAASYSYSPATTGPANQRDCYYQVAALPGYRDASGEPTAFYWHVITARLAFLVLFEHFVFLTKYLLQALIPDVPAATVILTKREDFLARQAMLNEYLAAPEAPFVSAVVQPASDESRPRVSVKEHAV